MTEGRAGRDSLLSGGSALAGLATGFGTVVFVAHDRGAAAAGVLFGAIGLFTILATVSKLGTETTFVYYAGQLRGRNDARRSTLIALLTLGLRPVAFVSTAVAIALLAGAAPLSEVLIDAEHAETYADVLRVLAPFVPVWAITLPLLGLLRGLGDLRPTAIGLQIIQPLAQLALVGGAIAADASLPVLALAWSVPLLVTLADTAHKVLSALPEPIPGEVAAPPGGSEFWGHATPRGIAGTLSMAVDRLGVVLVGALGSAEAAGAWTAITRLLGICFRVVHAMSQALNTKLPALLAAGRTRAALGQAHLASWWTIALLTPVLAVSATFPDAALGLFDMHDVDGAPEALRWAVIAAATTVVFAHVDNVLLMSGKSTLVMLDGFPSLAALIGLSAVLVPIHGLPGAAWAWIVSAAIYRGLAAVQVCRLHDGWTVTRRTAIDGAVLGAVSLGVSAAAAARFGDRLIVAIPVGAGCLALAAGAVVATRRRDRSPSSPPAGAATSAHPADAPLPQPASSEEHSDASSR